jgi:dienelactone hydrolase
MGFSLGALPAQKVAQTLPGVRGAVLLYSALPSAEFGGPWPADVAVQIHIAEQDENLEPGELDGAKALADEAADGVIFLYPGTAHLIAEKGFADFDPDSAALILSRTKEFLARVG